ncbi:MAG: nucleotidyltransferase domain-containing protein [Rhodospirillum sp.]|nr:nucleotidyltransferase domain-containing protein [Rhodospirillum sp.]MCF8490462.1 nucleotidyltransferase domain-containing protein [Rhodospirillum sp.]MCF8500841.1 nucleotidyltransferase domain-containing protein [Rhodospirillum sp.]
MTDPINGTTRREIEDRLAALEAQEGVRVLFAVESGSRAWGFPSPDSDYDVRFVYMRPRDWYLSLRPGRDVVERPITDEIDLNGWDVRKALGLMLKSNAVVSEWLASPIRYRPDDPMVERLAELADRSFDPRGLAHHYASLGYNAVKRWVEGAREVPVKRYFYVLRPALALRALRLAPGVRPPMDLGTLMVASDLPKATVGIIEDLVALKRVAREQDYTRRPAELDRLVLEELGRAADVPARKLSPEVWASANKLFLDLVNQ